MLLILSTQSARKPNKTKAANHYSLTYHKIPMLNKFTFTLLCTLLFFACGNEKSAAEKCKFGEPSAIFDNSNPEIETAIFEKKNGKGIETVQFKNQMGLELTQSGCQELVQDFAFRLPMTNPDADGQFWIEQGAQLMRYLGNLDPNLVQFSEWANVIKQAQSEMKLGEAKEIKRDIS